MALVTSAVCDVLAEAGIEYVFGIPGGDTVRLYDALYDYRDKIKAILVRHEQGASCMADIYGRLTGKPAVLMGQGPFIASNGAFGIMEAFLSSSPMLVLTDTSEDRFALQGYYQNGTGNYGSIDLPNIFRGMSKYAAVASNPKEAVQAVQQAIKHSIAGRPGPAVVLFRHASLRGEPDPTARPRIFPSTGYLNVAKPAAQEADLGRAVQVLVTAKSPAIIAGNGVHVAKAYAELQELAELIGAPVATSYKGKRTFVETHPLALGMMGAMGQKAARTIVGEADALLFVGCKVQPATTSNESLDIVDPTRQRIVQIDIEPRNVGWSFPVELGLVGDAKVVLGQIVATATETLKGRDLGVAGRTSAVVERKKKLDFFDSPALSSDNVPIYPQRLVRELQENTDPATIFTLDAGANRVWVSHYLQTKQPGTIFCPGGIAGMGWSAPAALAAKLVYPDRPVVSISGDGGFAMTSHAISTAVQYGLPVTFVVQNNSLLGWIHSFQGERVIATQFIDTDFARLAESYGARGIRTDNPAEVKLALRDAAKSNRPTVIDVVIDQKQTLASLRGQSATVRVK
ncbi:MAG: thiamine pyrophosphate-binding protein [Chloroflexi bacterium]|nr:thiamine pyrophosphate-binding protein [Chloroflexota bacterium]